MNIKLIPQFTAADIDKYAAEFLEKVFKITHNELQQVGLEFVRDARSKQPSVDYHSDAADIVSATKLAGASIDLVSAGGFNDQTGNLRSSIGFVIFYNGEIVSENFEESPRGTDKATGLTEGKSFAESEGIDHQSGWAIVTVAGMEYASWVEAKGYDVITGSTLGAQKKLEEAFARVLLEFD